MQSDVAMEDARNRLALGAALDNLAQALAKVQQEATAVSKQFEEFVFERVSSCDEPAAPAAKVFWEAVVDYVGAVRDRLENNEFGELNDAAKAAAKACGWSAPERLNPFGGNIFELLKVIDLPCSEARWVLSLRFVDRKPLRPFLGCQAWLEPDNDAERHSDFQCHFGFSYTTDEPHLVAYGTRGTNQAPGLPFDPNDRLFAVLLHAIKERFPPLPNTAVRVYALPRVDDPWPTQLTVPIVL
jgi:hypothetical protein